MVKEQYRETDVVRKITHVNFGIQSAEDIEQCSVMHVVAKNLYNQDSQRSVVTNGALDHRMGTSQKDSNCVTCGKGLSGKFLASWSTHSADRITMIIRFVAS